jgi:hypothetical protein
MPFQSEKQRRFMWAEHPELAKRWAKEYPNQRKLPMYAQNSKSDKKPSNSDENHAEKQSALNILRRSLLVYTHPASYPASAPIVKKSDSILEKVNIPHNPEPTAAGDEHITVQKEDKQCQATPDQAPNQAPIKPIADLRADEMAQKLAALFTKYSVDIRLGKKHKHLKQDKDDGPANKGIDYERIKKEVQAEKQRQAWASYWASVMPPDTSAKGQKSQSSKQDNSAVVATNPGVNSDTRMASNQKGMASGKANPIGLKGPLNTQNGIPTMQQNVTGNAAFGSV